MDRQLIERYAAGAGELGTSIAGLAREDLLAHPVPGTWSIQEIVIHLMDSDLVISDRMKRIIAEERPLVIGFDESKFAAWLHYEDQDAQTACEIFERNRQLTAEILRRLPDETFARVGIHSERGRVTLEDLVNNAVNHFAHHMKFIREKRRMLGKALD